MRELPDSSGASAVSGERPRGVRISEDPRGPKRVRREPPSANAEIDEQVESERIPTRFVTVLLRAFSAWPT